MIDSKIRHWIGDKVATFYADLKAKSLIEIGPGKGSLTALIKDVSPNFFIFEKDETLKEKLLEVLSENTTYHLIWGDVLEADFSDFSFEASTTLVVGNLPYYITSPILRKFFTPPSSPSFSLSKGVVGGLFMVQYEVGEKIRYDATKKSYLYWLLNYAYQVEYLKSVPAKAFAPTPKVKSCIVGLKRKQELPPIVFETLVRFLDFFCPYSRKTLGKISKMLEKKGVLFAIPEEFQSKRLEELDWEDLERILG